MMKPIQTMKSSIIKLSFFAIGVLLLIVLISNSWFQTEAGFTYVYQNTLSGNISVYTEPGVHFRMPGFSRLEEYKQVMTVSFGGDESSAAVTRHLPSISVRFADTYTGQIPATFRFKLSADAQKIIDMHKEFRSFNNLLDALIVKNSRNVTVITATQYTGEEFFQGGLNQFKTKLEDQLREGVYETERKQVEVEQTDLAPVGLEQDDSNKLQRTKQLIWKTVPILDDSGAIRRQNNPLDQYGIQVTQVTVGDPLPEDQLNRLLMDKKLLVAERIKTIQEQETARAQAKTEQLKKEIERTRAVQDVQREKELAVIKQTKEVDVAKQIALREIVEQQKAKDLAEIDKAKELAIAEANLSIQKANAEAAKFEAMAIRETGIAQADVIKAKYAALGAFQEIYIAEVQRDIAKLLYTNLSHFTVDMPDNYVQTIQGERSGQPSNLLTNLDIITAFGALNLMDKTTATASSSRQSDTTNPGGSHP